MACAQGFATDLALARSGDSEAMVRVAEALEFGRGVAMHEDSARYWMKQAAMKHHPAGMFMWGSWLVSRVYSASEYKEGIQWLTRAADTMQVNAMLKLSELYFQRNTGTEKDKFYNPALAISWLQKADSAGDKRAMFSLAECLATGKGIARNDSLAAIKFEQCAMRFNHARAMVRLGDLYFDGAITGRPEPFMAWHWFEAAYKNKTAGLEDRSLADVGLHKADQMVKQVHNLMFQSSPFLPLGAFEYRLQKTE